MKCERTLSSAETYEVKPYQLLRPVSGPARLCATSALPFLVQRISCRLTGASLRRHAYRSTFVRVLVRSSPMARPFRSALHQVGSISVGRCARLVGTAVAILAQGTSGVGGADLPSTSTRTLLSAKLFTFDSRYLSCHARQRFIREEAAELGR